MLKLPAIIISITFLPLGLKQSDNVMLVIGIVLLFIGMFIFKLEFSTGNDHQETVGNTKKQDEIDIKQADINRLIREGHTISAIKAYRALHGVGLKEAKESVEKLIDELFQEENTH